VTSDHSFHCVNKNTHLTILTMAISRLSRSKKRTGAYDSSDEEEDQPLIKDAESDDSKKGWKKKLKGLRGTTPFSESIPSMKPSSIKSSYLTGVSRSRRHTIKDALDKAVNVENDIPSSVEKWGQSSIVSLLSEPSNDQPPLPKPLKPPMQRSLRVLTNETNRSTESPKSNRRQISPKPPRPPSLPSIQSTTSSNGTMSRPQLPQTLKPLSPTSLVEADQHFDKNPKEDSSSNAKLSQKQPSQRSVNKEKAKGKKNRRQRSSRKLVSPKPSIPESAGVSTASVAENSQDVDTSTAGKRSEARSSVFSPPLPSKSESAIESRCRRQRPSVLSKLKKKSRSSASSTSETKLDDDETLSAKLSVSTNSIWSSRSDGLIERRKAALSPRRHPDRTRDKIGSSSRRDSMGSTASVGRYRKGLLSLGSSSRRDSMGSTASVGRYRKGVLSDFLDNPSRQQGSDIMRSPNPLRKDKGYISSFLGSSKSASGGDKKGNHEEYEQMDEDDEEQGMESASLGSNFLALGFQALESLYDDCT
jgi:hypothetical protein